MLSSWVCPEPTSPRAGISRIVVSASNDSSSIRPTSRPNESTAMPPMAREKVRETEGTKRRRVTRRSSLTTLWPMLGPNRHLNSICRTRTST